MLCPNGWGMFFFPTCRSWRKKPESLSQRSTPKSVCVRVGGLFSFFLLIQGKCCGPAKDLCFIPTFFSQVVARTQRLVHKSMNVPKGAKLYPAIVVRTKQIARTAAGGKVSRLVEQLTNYCLLIRPRDKLHCFSVCLFVFYGTRTAEL